MRVDEMVEDAWPRGGHVSAQAYCLRPARIIISAKRLGTCFDGVVAHLLHDVAGEMYKLKA